MRWFSKPVYSDVGTELYRFLTEEGELWELDPRLHGLRHLTRPVVIHIDHVTPVFSPDKELFHPYVRLPEGGLDIIPTTSDDDSRLRPAFDVIYDRLKAAQVAAEWRTQQDRVMGLLNMPTDKPSTFDDDCRTMAKAVLKGDMVAARALADRIIELSQETK